MGLAHGPGHWAIPAGFGHGLGRRAWSTSIGMDFHQRFVKIGILDAFLADIGSFFTGFHLIFTIFSRCFYNIHKKSHNFHIIFT